MTDVNPSIFLSYASSDRDRVLPFFEWLEKNGFNVWMDSRRLKPGQNWDYEIKRALEKAAFVLAFISNQSFDKRGYVQRELKLALDKRAEKLIDDIYLIPILLDDDVQIPDQIKDVQSIRASEPQCREQIVDALQHQLARLGYERREIQEKEQVFWTTRVKKEEWDGLPGYEVELQFFEFHSELYPNVSEIGEHIRGDLLQSLFDHRADKFSPSPEIFNYGQDKFFRTNTYDASCSGPVIVGKVISVPYAIYWYGAGAAHPNHHFETYSFLLDPVVRINGLDDVFKEPKAALDAVQSIIREQLYEISIDDDPEDKLDRDWINEGTKGWEDFSNFVVRPDGIEVLFAPYEIAAYACGSHSAVIPYDRIVRLLRPEYVSALGIQYLAWKSPE